MQSACPTVERTSWRAWAGLLGLLIALAIACRTPLQLPSRWHNPDESLYAAIVAFQSEGDVPWSESLVAAGGRPLHLAVYILCDLLFGHYPWLALDLAHSVIVGATAWLLTLVCHRLLGLGWWTRLGVGLVFILHTCLQYEGLTDNSEHLTNLLHVAFLACWLGGHARGSRMERCLAFFFLGLAITIKKQQFPLVLCAPAFWLLAPGLHRSPRGFVLEMGSSALLVLAPELLLSLIFSLPPGGPSETYALAFSGGYGLEQTRQLFTRRILADPLALPALLIALPVVLRARSIRSWPLLSTSFFFLLSVLSLFPGLRMHEHYFLLITPGALLVTVVGVHRVLESRLVDRRSLVIATSVLLFLQYPLISRWLGREDDPAVLRLADWVREHTSPQERIFVWGWLPDVYTFADRVPSSRFASAGNVVNDLQGPNELPPRHPDNLRTLLQDLAAHPPACFVVVHAHRYTREGWRYDLEHLPELLEFLSERYGPELLLENGQFGIHRLAEAAR